MPVNWILQGYLELQTGICCSNTPFRQEEPHRNGTNFRQDDPSLRLRPKT